MKIRTLTIKIFFLFLFILSGTYEVYGAKYDGDYGIIIEEGDKKEDIYRIIKEREKESLKIWNNHTEIIGNYKKDKVCGLFEELIEGKRDNSDHLKNYIVGIGCFVNEKGSRKSIVRTIYEDEKVFNINIGQKEFNGMILRKGEEVSANKLLEPLENKFKTGNVLFYNKDKKEVEVRRETGGGICGVTTSLYQNFIYDNNIDIIERWNHSNWYTAYYGNTKGLDAMIYFGQSDFRFRNNNDSNIILELGGEKKGKHYEYYALSKSLFKNDRNIIHGNQYRDKKGRTCVDLYVGGRIETSCYRNIF